MYEPGPATLRASPEVQPAAPLRVLMLNDYGQPSGGAELQMLALRDGLRARGHKVRLMTSDASLSEGFPLLADTACAGRTDRFQALSQAVNPSAYRALRAELAEHPPDVVHIRMFLWQLSPLVLPLLRDVPTLFQAAVYKAICPNGLKLLPDGSACTQTAGAVCRRSGCVAPMTWAATMMQLRMVRRWRRNIDTVSTLSRRMADRFAAEGWDNILVMGNGVDERPARSPLTGPPLVVYAGRLAREKGIGTALAAFSQIADRIPEAQFLIAGDGSEAATLRAQAALLGDRVRFLGHLPRAEMERVFDAAWVQLVPSLWEEPFGNVTTEAMMRGTAVIASDVGGQSDIVRDGQTGYLVPPGDADALAARLTEILSDRGHAERLGAKARQVALTDYSRDAVLDRLISAYQLTVSRAAAGGAS
ncbi:MAG: glycosyltransferase family 4 protein [Pseudomonadota bacterium]